MTKTIVEKLNLQKYERKAIINVPQGIEYFTLLHNVDTELKDGSYNLIFTFVYDIAELKQFVQQVIEKNYLAKDGYLFFAYPKKGNKVYSTYIHRDELFPSLNADEEGYMLASTIKFNRMVGLDDVFTVVGLKEDGKNKNKVSTKASQCVDDYIEFIPAIEKDLADSPSELAFYKALTFGYQKDWARYVYSAKQEETKEKRREEMKMILSQGHKTRDLYRRNK